MHPRTRLICTKSIAAFALAVSATVSAHAQNIWNGSTDALWDTNANWSLGVKPIGSDDLIFPTPVPGTGPTITLGVGEVGNNLAFRDSYTLTGGDLSLTTNGISVDATFTATLVTTLAGGTNLTKSGAGTLFLSNVANTFTGRTILSGGTLSIANELSLGPTPAAVVSDQLQLSGGTLKFGTGIASIAANRGITVTNGTNVMDGNGNTIVVNSALNVTGGAGTSLLFTTTSGTATIFTLAQSATNNANVAFTIDPLVTLNLGNNSTVGNLAGNVSPVTINAGGILRFNRSNGTSFNTDISGGGQVSVANNTGQIVTLNPTTGNTYSGGTNIGGTNATVLGTGDSAFGVGAINFIGGGTIASNNATARNFGNNVTSTGTITVGQTTVGTGAITLGDVDFLAGTRTITTNVNTTVGAVNNGTGLTKGAAGTLTITGAGNVTGTVAINTSSLLLAGPNASLVNASTLASGDNNGHDETLVLGSNADVWTNGALNRVGDTAIISLRQAAAVFNGPASGSTGFEETAGTLELQNGYNSFTVTPATGQEAQITFSTITRGNSAVALVRGTGLGVATGTVDSGRFVVTNPANLNLRGAGGTGTTQSIAPFLIGGTSETDAGSTFLAYNAASGLRPLTNADFDTTIAGTTLRNVTTTGEAVGSAARINSLRVESGTVTLAAPVQVNSGAVLFTGAGTVGGGTLDFGAAEGVVSAANASAFTATLNSSLRGSGGLTLSSSGANSTIFLGGDNRYLGTTTINSGTVTLGSAGALSSVAPSVLRFGTGNAAGGTILRLNGNSTAARDISTISGGTMVIENNSATPATFTEYAQNSTTSQVAINNGATGTLAFVKTGPQTLTLPLTSSYSGGTTVRGGVLLLSGNGNGRITGAAPILISDGATLRLSNNSGANQTDRVPTQTVTLRGGNFDFDNNATGANYSETAGTLDVQAGSGSVFSDQTASANTSALTFTSLQRSIGGAVFFRSQANGTETAGILGANTRATIAFTAAPTLNDGLIGGWAYYGLTDFATYNTTTFASVKIAAYSNDLAPASWTTASNVKNTVASLVALPAGTTTVNSLNFAIENSGVNIGAGNTLNVDTGGIIHQGTAAGANNVISGGSITAGSDLVLRLSGAATVGISSAIVDNAGGSVGFTRTGNGTVNLTGANTFTGPTSLNGALTNIDSDARLGTAPAVPTAGQLKIYSGTLGVTQTTTLNANRSLEVGGTAIISISAGTAGNGKTLTYNGAISSIAGTEGSLRFQDNFTATNLDPGKINANLTALDLGGELRIDAGTVTVASSAPSVSIGRNLRVGTDGPATFSYTGASNSLTVGKGVGDTLDVGQVGTDVITAPALANTSIAVLNLGGLGKFTANVDQVRIGLGGANQEAKGTVTLAINNDISAATQILVSDSAGQSQGASQVGGNSSIVFGSGISNVTTPLFTLGGRKGSASATIAAGGTVNLNGFGGNTMALYIGRNNQAGTGVTDAIGVFDASGGTLTASLDTLTIGVKQLAGAAGADTGTLTLGSSAANAISVNTVTVGSIDTASGPGTATIGAGTINMGGGSFVANGDVNLATFIGTVGATTGTINLTGGSFVVGGNITKTDDLHSQAIVNVNGPTAALSLQNTAAGDTTPGSATLSQLNFRQGTLTNAASITLDGRGVTNGITFNSFTDALILRDTSLAATLSLTNATANAGGIHYEAAGGGIGATLGAIDLGAVDRTFNVEDSAAAANDLAVAGAISGSVTLTKSGAGTLALNGSVAGSVNVTAGTLGGSGTIAGAVSLGANTTLSPGNSPGTLTTGDLSLNTASASRFELTMGNTVAGAGINDLVLVNGSLTLGGTIFISELGGLLGNNVKYVLFDYSGTFTDNGYALDSAFLTAHPFASIVIDPVNTQVLLAVPEPGSIATLLSGLGLLLGMQRFRRRQS